MILKASQRGGGTQLGLHLLKTENEHVEVHEVRGFCAEDVLGAMKEAQAVARGTRCKQFLFSVSLSPPETAFVPVDAFERALERIEKQTGLTGQPRIVVFHEKEGRRHAHAVWSRIDAETMTAKPLPFFKSKLRDISKSLYLEHGWSLPRGFVDREQRDPRNFGLSQWQQAKRMSRDPKALKEAIQECWSLSDNRTSFEAALEQRGLYLARGDRRAHVAVSFEGEVCSLSRMTGRKTRELAARLGDPEELRSVAETKKHIARAIAPKLRHLIKENARAKQRDMEPLEARRLAMRDAHREHRQELDKAQRQRSQAEGQARAARLRKGVAGLWDRLTGRRKETLRQNRSSERCRCMTRIGNLASKSVNQYRTRDVFAYLGLRYCVDNQAARTDAWAQENAVQITLGSQRGRYLRSYHFKQLSPSGNIERRDLYIPSASESLAEAVLLSNCTTAWEKMSAGSVFSYHPTHLTDRKSFFKPYMDGLRRRQAEIARACDEHPDGIVAYIDLKNFYSSITPGLARSAWLGFARHNRLSSVDVDLGNRLISNYEAQSEGKSILTGPMFAHFLANLVLAPVDEWAKSLPATYLRYVDDMTLVGPREQVIASIKLLRTQMEHIGLQLHEMSSPKTLIVSANYWQGSAADFAHGEHSVAWMRLIGDIKKLLLFGKASAEEIGSALAAEGFRLPIPDYDAAIREASSFERVRELGLWGWLAVKTRRISVQTIVASATTLSSRLAIETKALLADGNASDTFQRKRLVSKIRYRLGRLIYLGTRKDIEVLAMLTKNWPELEFHTAIMNAVLSRNCSRVISLGSNVAQATAQVFRASLETAEFSKPVVDEVDIQGLATFILNGVPVRGELGRPDHPLIKFARGPVDRDLMRQPRGLLQELACLHGFGEIRHPDILASALDIDDLIVLDALELDYGYYL